MEQISKLFGYCRVSTDDQTLDVQRAALLGAGVPAGLIFEEKASGTKREGRGELERVLALLRYGDVLVVTRIDRLARSMVDFANIVHDLKSRGIGFRCTEQAIDTSGPMGELTMNILAAFAQFETQLRAERQREGIAKAKQDGKYKGRKPTVPIARVRELASGGMGPAEIARTLGIGRASVYRALSA